MLMKASVPKGERTGAAMWSQESYSRLMTTTWNKGHTSAGSLSGFNSFTTQGAGTHTLAYTTQDYQEHIIRWPIQTQDYQEHIRWPIQTLRHQECLTYFWTKVISSPSLLTLSSLVVKEWRVNVTTVVRWHLWGVNSRHGVLWDVLNRSSVAIRTVY